MDAFTQALDQSAGCAVEKMPSIQPPSVLAQLKQQRERAQAQLQDLNQAIEALEANPETVRILDLLGKVRRY